MANEVDSPDLSAAVDVYADWIDACDTVAKNDARAKSRMNGEAAGEEEEGAGEQRGGVMGEERVRGGYGDEEEELDEAGLEGVGYAGM